MPINRSVELHVYLRPRNAPICIFAHIVMKTIFVGKNCIEVEQTDSANDYMANLPPEQVFEGTVVVAKEQSLGKGQRGNSWLSEPGKNLTISILLRPSFLFPTDQFQLNKAVALGVLDLVVSQIGKSENVRVKWPNDVYIGTKKVCGILIENSVSGNRLLQSIVGIGLNVNQEEFPDSLPNPTSLKLEAGKEFNLKECLEELCACTEKRYLQLRSMSRNIDADYLSNLYRFGDWAAYDYLGNRLQAKITGVGRSGKLTLETIDGKILECDFKEVMYITDPSSFPPTG